MKRGRKPTPRLPTGMPKPVAELAMERLETDYLDAINGTMPDPKAYLLRMEAAQVAYDHYTQIGGEGVPIPPPEDDAALTTTRTEIATDPDAEDSA